MSGFARIDSVDQLRIFRGQLVKFAERVMVSLADAEGCIDRFDDEARAHASFYAVQSSTTQNLRLLTRGIGRLFNSH